MSTAEIEAGSADLPARVRLAAFLAEVAPRLQRLPPDQLDGAIRAALEGVLEALDMDRISITEFSLGAKSYRFSYAHWRPGLPPLEVGVEKAASFPWYAAQVQRGRKLVFSRLPEDLPQEARAEFAPLVSIGMKSLVLLPLDDDHEVVGCLAISSFRDHREFSPELLSRLDLLASVFAGALLRSRFESKLRDARDLSRSIMVSITNAAVVLDREGRVTAVNEALGRARSILAKMCSRLMLSFPPDTATAILSLNFSMLYLAMVALTLASMDSVKHFRQSRCPE